MVRNRYSSVTRRRVPSVVLYLDDPDPVKRRFPDGHPFSGFLSRVPIRTNTSVVGTREHDQPGTSRAYINEEHFGARVWKQNTAFRTTLHGGTGQSTGLDGA